MIDNGLVPGWTHYSGVRSTNPRMKWGNPISDCQDTQRKISKCLPAVRVPAEEVAWQETANLAWNSGALHTICQALNGPGPAAMTHHQAAGLQQLLAAFLGSFHVSPSGLPALVLDSLLSLLATIHQGSASLLWFPSYLVSISCAFLLLLLPRLFHATVYSTVPHWKK